MRINTIYDSNKNKKKVRVGRGIGSGKGKTCGAGHKGQKARTGVAIKGFEGGQMPIYMRLPKRGFNSLNKITYKAVGLSLINKLIKDGKIDFSKTITKQTLKDLGLISKILTPVKLVLTNGEAADSLKDVPTVNIEVDCATKSAISLVEKSGGKIIH